MGCQGRQPGDVCEACRRSNRGDDGVALSFDDERASVQLLSHLERRRLALAGQGRGIDEQPFGVQNLRIGRDAIAGDQEQQVVDLDRQARV